MHASTRHKVLLFIPHLEQGGAERQILELMSRLPKERFEPELCLYRSGGTAHYASYLPGKRQHVLDVDRMGPAGLLRLIRLIQQVRPAIVHSYRDKANLWARLATVVAPVPVVLTSVRNRYQGPLYMTAERVLQGYSDRVLANSRGIEEELVEWSGVAPGRIQVINNFVDLEEFRLPTDAERAAARERFGFAPTDLILVLPGRIAIQKHQLGLLAALARLRRRGTLPRNIKVVLAGRQRDKYYGTSVWLAMRALGLGEQVVYFEPVHEMRALYHAADALVMPSLYEGMPNAVLEAHACGLPCVVSHAANRDRIVLDGISGYEVPTFDHPALATAIERICVAGNRERRAMGERGHAHVAHAFHPDPILEETVALYNRLLAEKGCA
jgi:glycosyltransferase involved in cell wall biosynthesis